MSNREISSAIVTGPTGAIGRALCSLLAAEGIHVYAVCRPDSKRMQALSDIEGVEVVQLDLSDINALVQHVDFADAFFHLAWDKTVGVGRNDMLAQTENIRASLLAVQTAQKLGCKVFIGAGSQAEYGRSDQALTPQMVCRPETGYGMAKLCAGQMCRALCEQLNMDFAWGRILSVYGPGESEASLTGTVIKSLLCGAKPSLTLGEQQWDYLYSDDAARALMLMAKRGKSGAVYVLGSGEAKPLRYYIEAIRDAIDPLLPLGFGELPYAANQVMYLRADISDLQRDTGFRPLTDFASGVGLTIEYYKEQLKKNG